MPAASTSAPNFTSQISPPRRLLSLSHTAVCLLVCLQLMLELMLALASPLEQKQLCEMCRCRKRR